MIKQLPIEQSAVEQPPIQQPPIQQSSIQQSSIQQSLIEQSAVEQPPIQQSFIQQSLIEQSAVEQPPIQQSSIQQSSIQQSLIEQSPVDSENPFDARVIEYCVPLGALRKHWYPRQTPLKERSKRQFEKGRFRTITTEGQRHIMLRSRKGRGGDWGVLGYIVPAEYIMDADYRDSLTTALEELPKLTQSQNAANKGTGRGLKSSRCYCIWCAYGLKPMPSSNYTNDGESAKRFVEDIKPLWDKASEILRQVFPRIHRSYESINLPAGMELMAGQWMGMAINTGTLEHPVQCTEHRDIKVAKYGISCLCPLGDFQGGEVVLWELKTKVSLRPGDLLFLRDNLITHSNDAVEGVRHSLVAFTRQDIFHWKERLGEDCEDRDEDDKERDLKREQIWREEDRYKEESRLPLKKRRKTKVQLTFASQIAN
jgi:hypothetical protein